MNKVRRANIKETVDLIERVKSVLESILDEEQEYYDNIPENLQTSQRAEDSEDAISNLEDAISNLEEAIGNLEEVV